MNEIFISYRRIDAEDSAGRLFDHLSRSFGPDSVFMDQHPNRIPWGSKWEEQLNGALENCDALVALIGPHWADCKRSDGRRRLDVEGDWVRHEIATALRRGILVVPVLLKEGRPPGDADLPPELRSDALNLPGRQLNTSPLTVANWEAVTAELIAELRKRPALRALHDLATAQTGIRLLEELIRRDEGARDAVRQSRHTIEATDQDVDRLKGLKGIHDALHRIEADCLRPLDVPSVPAYQADLALCAFQREANLIRQELAAGDADLPTLLTKDLARDLGEIEATLARAADPDRSGQPTAPADIAPVLYGLRGLASVTSVQLDTLLDSAAERLRLNKLLDLIRTVRDVLPAGADRDAELKPLLGAIDALASLRSELELRVREHGRMQNLDRKLRRVCGGDWNPGRTLADEPRTPAADWQEVRGARDELTSPSTEQLAPSLPVMARLEQRIDRAVAADDRPACRNLLRAYFQEVGVAFKSVDDGLKAFCDQLSRATAPLKAILDMLPVGG